MKKYDRKDCEIFYLRESFREYFALKKVPDYDYDYKDFLKYCETHHPNIQFFIKKYGNPYEVECKQWLINRKEGDKINNKRRSWAEHNKKRNRFDIDLNKKQVDRKCRK